MSNRLFWIRRRAWQLIAYYKMPMGQHWHRPYSIREAVHEAALDRNGLYHD